MTARESAPVGNLGLVTEGEVDQRCSSCGRPISPAGNWALGGVRYVHTGVNGSQAAYCSTTVRPMQPTDPIAVVERLRVERHHRWEWPPVPEGWRACDNQTLDDDGRLWRTVTNAPRNESPFNHEHEWVEARRIDEQRWVSEWEATDG